MRKILFIVVILLLFIFSAKKEEEGIILKISASSNWKDTGIKVGKDSPIIIKYIKGKWRLGPNDVLDPWVDARGLVGINDEYNLTSGALIGKIGKNAPFEIADYYEIKDSEHEGKLFLKINDVNLLDNSGMVKIRIIVK